MAGSGYRQGMMWDTYARISDDPNDLQRGVKRQHEDTLQAVREAGGTVGKDHPENDTSAYRKKRVTVTDTSGNTYDGYRVIRPVWHTALQRLRTGEADGLMVYDLDRLARDPRDLEDAIEVVEHYGKPIVSATASEIDLTTESGRMSARLMVVMANKASADTARRVKRAALANALEGKPVGKRAFGWSEGNRILHPAESELVRMAVADLLAGSATVTAIANRWNDAGVTTARGNPWRNVTVRQYLRHPRLAGFRVHQKQLLRSTNDGAPVVGQWEPLLGVDTWERLQSVITGRKDSRGRIPKASSRYYLLTALLRCGVCNSPMYGNVDKRRGHHYYRCTEYRTSRNGVAKHTQTMHGPMTDEAVTAVVLAHLSTQEDSEAPCEPEPWPGEDDLARSERKIVELMEAFNTDALSGAVVFPQVREWEAKAATLTADRRAWLANTTAGPVVAGALDEWPTRVEAGDVTWQRSLFEKVLEAVLVKPTRPDVRGYDRGRLAYVWRR